MRRYPMLMSLMVMIPGEGLAVLCDAGHFMHFLDKPFFTLL
ncbi:hypothetical protein [Acidithiobacillus sp.]|jgi:hypothetical protein